MSRSSSNPAQGETDRPGHDLAEPVVYMDNSYRWRAPLLAAIAAFSLLHILVRVDDWFDTVYFLGWTAFGFVVAWRIWRAGPIVGLSISPQRFASTNPSSRVLVEMAVDDLTGIDWEKDRAICFRTDGVLRHRLFLQAVPKAELPAVKARIRQWAHVAYGAEQI